MKQLNIAYSASLALALVFAPVSSFAVNSTESFVNGLEKSAAKAPAVSAPFGFAAQGVPAVLSDKDVTLYKWMFKKQRQLKREEVASKLSQLDDSETLMGYLIAERLLHPNKRASYADLKKWLAKYNDHAPAATIYKIAQDRKPKSAGAPNEPKVKVLSLARYGDPDDALKGQSDAVKNTSKRRELLQTLKQYRVNGDYDKSLLLLKKASTKRLLGENTWHEVSLTLARSLLNHNHFKDAEKLANDVAESSPNDQPEGLWIAGFAAYRGGDEKAAVKYFRRLVYTVPQGSSYYARAAWWTARAYEDMNQASMSRVFLNMAAQDKLSFYGQMAQENLGKKGENLWVEPKLPAAEMKALLKNKVIRRVIALAQIGEHVLAQQELKTAYDSIPYDLDESLLALSMRLNLPNTSMTLARNLYDRDTIYLSGLYPSLDEWQPYGGYQVDQALIHAIIRQESAFNPKVKSRAGARGLMQLMPGTAKFVRAKQGKKPYSKTALHHPKLNIGLGQTYVQYLEDRLNGNLIKMIAGYNAGPGNVEKWLEEDAAMAQDPVMFIESIPFGETRKYVRRVMANYWMYSHRFEQDTPSLSAMARHQWPSRARIALR